MVFEDNYILRNKNQHENNRMGKNDNKPLHQGATQEYNVSVVNLSEYVTS